MDFDKDDNAVSFEEKPVKSMSNHCVLNWQDVTILYLKEAEFRFA